jgi:RNA polymerase-binding transcription factor DksA
MVNEQKVITRYPDSELEEFRVIIQDKLEKTTAQYQNVLVQIKEITENTSGDYTKDLSDFSSSQTEVELLNSMASRQRLYIQDLQNALARIRNKTYGICFVTGMLIEKRRLLAVPTTTKSVAAKQITAQPVKIAQGRGLDEAMDEDQDNPKPKARPAKKPEIITKVIKKTNPNAVKSKADVDDEFDKILGGLDDIKEDYDEIYDDDMDMDDVSIDDIDDIEDVEDED